VGNPAEFLVNLGPQPEPHTITAKVLNDSGSELRQFRIVHPGEQDGNGKNNDDIILNNLSDALTIRAVTDGVNFTGYDITSSHLVRITGTNAAGGGTPVSGVDTLLELSDTDSSYQPDLLWQTNSAGTAAVQSNYLDGGVI